MMLKDRQRELICEILLYYSANIEELNAKLYPIDDPILVRPEGNEILEIIRLMLADSVKERARC